METSRRVSHCISFGRKCWSQRLWCSLFWLFPASYTVFASRRKKERKNNTTTWRSRKDFPSYGWSQAGSRPESRKVSPGVVPPRPSPCSFHCNRGPTQSVSNTHNGLTSGSWPSFYSSSSSIVWWLEKWKKNCRSRERLVGRSTTKHPQQQERKRARESNASLTDQPVQYNWHVQSHTHTHSLTMDSLNKLREGRI